MALKPDVTLSIVKNNKDRPDSITKLYYNENVYRVSKGTNSFKEIMQTGLECMGKVEDACIGEVLYLAAESLNTIKSDFILEISNLEILSACVEMITNLPSVKNDIIKCASEKNVHGITEVCRINNIPYTQADPLKDLLGFYGDPEKVISLLRSSSFCDKIKTETEKLEKAISIFEGTALSKKVVIDFSLVGDTNYYNGIIFKGFLNGLPGGVLSGGQYDKLMSKMGRISKAIGFAVYLDMLDRLN
jgi:ATP phosphoribosyltransferase regulatory subunit